MSDKLPACRGIRQRATQEDIDKLKACRTFSEEVMENHLPNFPSAATRCDFLARAANGFGALALSYLLARDAKALDGGTKPFNPLAPKRPHFEPKAKAVIFLYMVGGPSQMETFDPKPALDRLHGQQLPPSFGEIKS